MILLADQTEGLVDAHVHSLKSDGVATPMQLASLAKRSGLAALVLADHDVLHDPEELIGASAASEGVVLIGGVELSTQLGDRGLHLLGYGFDPNHPGLAEACRRRVAFRRERWSVMVERLAVRGVRLDRRRLEQIGAGSSPGRRHLARELIRLKQASSQRDAFARYLGDAGRQATDEYPLTIQRAIELLHLAGGKAVLAHPPANLTRGDWKQLTDAGLDGLETDFPTVAKLHHRFLLDRVREYRLARTGGSDYHGEAAREFLGSCTMSLSDFSEFLGEREG